MSLQTRDLGHRGQDRSGVEVTTQVPIGRRQGRPRTDRNSWNWDHRQDPLSLSQTSTPVGSDPTPHLVHTLGLTGVGNLTRTLTASTPLHVDTPPLVTPGATS